MVIVALRAPEEAELILRQIQGYEGLIGELNIPISEIDEVFPRVVTRFAELEVKHGPPLGTLGLVE